MNRTVDEAVRDHLDKRFDALEDKLDALSKLFAEVHEMETKWQDIELPQFEITKKLL